MSKQSVAKEKQGFKKDSPKCYNCKHFESSIEMETSTYGTFERERNLRCTLGSFKVGKSNYCSCHEYK